MKSVLSFVIAIGVSAYMQAQSPITIVSSDLPDEGESFLVTNASPLIAFDGTDTGPDHNWNFSTLVPVTQDTTNWIDENDTNPIYFFLWFTSDIAEQSVSNIVNDFITITDVYNFYQLDNSTFAFAGFAGTIAGIPFPIGYDDNEVILNFPADYGQISNSNTGFNISIPDIGGWNESRDRSNEIDGWGQVTTPAGTYDALRLHSVINIIDTFTYDTFVLPVAYTTNEYRWLSKETGIPVLQINTQTVLGVETISSIVYFEDYYESAISEEQDLNNNLQIAQPVVNEAMINFTATTAGNYQFCIFNLNGEIISTSDVNISIGENRIVINVDALPMGTYLLQCNNEQGEMATKQFIKIAQ